MERKSEYRDNYIFKAIVSMLLGFVMMACMSLEINAAPKQMPDGNLFDAQFYAETYPDIAAILGMDETLLYNHYILSGRQEGRMPFAQDAITNSIVLQMHISQKLTELKNLYPDGTQMDIEDRYVGYTIQDALFGSDFVLNMHDTGLQKWAVNNGLCYTMSYATDYIWYPDNYIGQDPMINARFEEYWSKLQVGDGIKVKGNFMVVLSKDNDYVTVVEGYDNGKIRWERMISKEIFRRTMMRVESYMW